MLHRFTVAGNAALALYSAMRAWERATQGNTGMAVMSCILFGICITNLIIAGKRL